MGAYDRQQAANLMFDFITAMTAASNVDAIISDLTKVSRTFGLDCFAISGIPLPGEKIDSYVLLSAWPEGWFDRYVQENYVHIDPVIYQSRISDCAFVWSEELRGKPIRREARKLMNEASEFRMIDGYSVPLHMPGALQAIVTFGAEKIDLSAEAKGILHIVAIYAHNRLRALLEQQSGAGKRETPHITRHERDVIRWCAEGKTNWEIGQILGRSEKTVQHELHNAQRKMNCVNRAQLIAEAIRTGLIR
ncbi:LuxR family transcriptional regulator [Agrobacterium rhizogenes]|uniref:helix-turn-helix transcriptional regulator n=1 Tax=Rhizobium rhizogenes TaxID=359 RepID=UPI0022B6591F|nr:LuxR family transcriptional regulator [Rhizobium rhizogenes]MCZ7450269.1 LuxR family transcriptional regulator [Rhizobium rhizogenes]